MAESTTKPAVGKNDKAGKGGNNNGAVKTKKVDGLRVTTKRDGFRRGGREWQGTTDVPVTEFKTAQLKQLAAEHGNMLIIEEIKIEIEAKD